MWAGEGGGGRVSSRMFHSDRVTSCTKRDMFRKSTRDVYGTDLSVPVEPRDSDTHMSPLSQ